MKKKVVRLLRQGKRARRRQVRREKSILFQQRNVPWAWERWRELSTVTRYSAKCWGSKQTLNGSRNVKASCSTLLHGDTERCAVRIGNTTPVSQRRKKKRKKTLQAEGQEYGVARNAVPMYPRENPTPHSGPRSLCFLDLHLQFYRDFRRWFLPRCVLEKTRILEGHLTALSQRWLLGCPKFARVFCSNRQIKSGRCGLHVWRQQRNTLISWSWRSRLELELESQQFVSLETLQKFVSFGRCTDGKAGSKDYGRRLGKPSGWTAWALEPAAMFQSGFASPNLTFHCLPIFFHLSQPWRWWWDVPRPPGLHYLIE